MKEYRVGNAVVCVTRPELSDKERAKRERALLIALEQYGKLIEKEKSNDLSRQNQVCSLASARVHDARNQRNAEIAR